MTGRPHLTAALAAALLAACGAPPPAELERLTTFEPENFSAVEDGIRRHYRNLQADLERSLEDPAGAGELASAAGRIGMWFHVYEHYGDAAAVYEAVEKIEPGNAAWPYYLGYASWSRGDFAAAETAWRRVAERRPDYLPVHVQLAELALTEGDLEAARSHLRSAGRLGGEHPRVLAVRAEIALQENRLDDARELFAEVLRDRPRSRRARYGLGMALRGLGRLAESEPHLAAARGDDADPLLGLEDPYLQALGEHDTSSRQMWRRGHAALEAGRLEEALEWLGKAVEAAPGRADYRLELGSALARAGRAEEARDVYEGVLEDEPHNDGARLGLAALAAAAGRDREAEAEHRAVLASRPDHAGAHLGLAHLLRRRGDSAALEHYERAVELDPRDESARFWRAATRYLQGNPAAAARLLDADLRILGNRAMLLSLRARLATRPGAGDSELGTARDVAAGLFRRRPSVFTAETLAMALAAGGDFGEAARRQETALAGARAAGIADLEILEERLASYRSGRRTAVLFAPSETAGLDVSLPGDR